jgi:hypothetical protein
MSLCLVAALLAALFLRSVGIVGHRKVIRHVDSDQTIAVHTDEPEHEPKPNATIPDSPISELS